MHKDMRRSKAWESTIRKAHLQFRGCTIFSAMSVLPYDDADRPSSNPPSPPAPLELHHVERLLPNGDFYMGIASHDVRPHGPGKYLWTDGCMYEGEWVLGKATGKGRFSWPSGATYEGEFKSWLLEGSGTFTGASGDTYRGSFSMNLKHGHGRRTYPNGDYYDGEWRKGVQEGHGRYVWKNGHEYNGSWKAGNMSGKGVLFWANGNSYDGEWDNGVPGGKGQFRWPDGAVFVGIWCKDQRSQKGTNLVSASPENVRGEPEEELEVGLGECKVCSGENISVIPSQKATHWTGNGSEKTASRKPERSDLGMLSRLRRSSVDAVQAMRRGSTGSGERGAERSRNWESDGDISCNVEDGNVTSGTCREPVTPEARRNQPLKWRSGEVKKQGDTISKGHKNYELMLNLQLGIRHSVGRPAPATSLDIKASAFDPKEKVWTRFPPEGSKHTPPHQSCDFRWKDYCPVVFRTLRKLFKVDPADYMLSLCGNDALRELSSPGKSGSFFYLSHDDRYMIKTVKKTEVKVLLRMLPAYYNHVRSFENSLVTKFFGLHCVKLTGATQKKVRFVIMGNLFCTDYPIHRRFDLKGSSHGRTTEKPESEIDETTTLKDLDLNFIFRLPKCWFQEFVRQVERDSAFLEQEKIMDYSLLVGLHFSETASTNEAEDRCLTRNFSNGPRLHRGDMVEPQSIPNKQSVPVKLGISLPCRVETIRRISSDAQSIAEPTGETYNVILFFGIIDILQDYDISKKLEHAYKSMQYDPSSISAVDPKQYSKRFRDFMFHVFTEDC